MQHVRLIFIITTCFLFNFLAIAQHIEAFVVDKHHANIVWHASHMGFSSPSGKFTKVTGFINLNHQQPKNSNVEIIIKANSISTGNKIFNLHLKGKNFFNVKKHKNIIFKSTKIEPLTSNTANVYGNLTMLGITKPVVLHMVLNKIGKNEFTGKRTVGFSGSTIVKRSEFGMNYATNLISDNIFISIELEAFID